MIHESKISDEIINGLEKSFLKFFFKLQHTTERKMRSPILDSITSLVTILSPGFCNITRPVDNLEERSVWKENNVYRISTMTFDEITTIFSLLCIHRVMYTLPCVCVLAFGFLTVLDIYTLRFSLFLFPPFLFL